MNFPTYQEYCLSARPSGQTYLETYLEAKGLAAKELFGRDTAEHTLAFLAFNLVEANFRLGDMSMYPTTPNAVLAQAGEVAGWQNKLQRFMEERRSKAQSTQFRSLHDIFLDDFSKAATDSRIPTLDDISFVALARAGRIGEIPPETTQPFIHAWEETGVGNETDSAFYIPPKAH